MRHSILAIEGQMRKNRLLLLMRLAILVPVAITTGMAIAGEPEFVNGVRKQGKALKVTIRHVTAIQVGTESVSVVPSRDIEGDRPSCATNKAIFAINPSSPGGRAALALILSAASEGTTVDLWGTGACNNAVKSDAEELEAVVLRYGE